MKQLKKDLRELSKGLKALTKKTEKLMKAAARLDKSQPKAKPKKTAVKKRVVKRVAKITATDQVLRIIKRSKKGVDVPTLVNKTGFDEIKVRNIVFKAAKQKKIKRVGRGVYVGA